MANPDSPEQFGRVVILSPHLDDAAFSLGAFAHAAAKSGAEVTIVTVFAGDPESTAGAGSWDGRAGFRTYGEAIRARRAEDDRAAGVLGAHNLSLPFVEDEYGPRPPRQRVWSAVAPLLEAADTAFVPGFPLVHPDHRWLTTLVLDEMPAIRLGLYVEQPYAVVRRRWQVWHRGRNPGKAESLEPYVPDGLSWQPLRTSREDQAAKRAACEQYRSQVALWDRGSASLTLIGRYDRRHGGELIAWVPDPR